jgi:hypothetical protein
MGILEGMVRLFVTGHFQTGKNTSKQGKNTSKQGKNTSKQVGNTSKQEEIPFKQEKHLSSKGNAFQARGIFRSNVEVYKW